MRLVADNLWAHVEGAPHELEWLRSYLTVESKGAEHSSAYQAGHWDGTVKLFDMRRARIATGLMRLVVGRAREKGFAVTVVDQRIKPPGEIQAGWGEWLRPYQREAVDKMLARGRGIVQMPTGSGKTEVFSALAQAVPVRWLILVDTKDLMHQAAAKFAQRTGELAGVCGEGRWEPRRVTVATLQTMMQELGDGGRTDQLLQSTQGIVSDESHVIAATVFKQVAMATPNAWYRFGVSATPLEREDEQDYCSIECLGVLIHELPVQVLFDLGHLARPTIWMVEHQHERMTGEFRAIYEAGVVLSEKRNALVTRLVAARDLSPRPSIVFFKSLFHGRRLLKDITPYASTELINGATQTIGRNGAKRRLMAGHTDVLLVSRIWNKGVDLPEVLSGVNAAGGAAVADALQKVGRLMRVVPGKTRVRYWDILDRGNFHLEDHARKRMAAYQGRGYEIRVIGPGDVERVRTLPSEAA
jgi:DNA excision repair protein ERCC-3